MALTPPLTLPARPGAQGLMTSIKAEALRYLRTVEAEYLTGELRYQIYTVPNDRKFYATRILLPKRERILATAAREKLPCIFDQTPEGRQLLDQAMAKLYGTGGYPTFHYKDYTDTQRFVDTDRQNYYQTGRLVRLPEGLTGRCVGLCDDGRVRVRLEGHSRKSPTRIYPATQVTRVFRELAGQVGHPCPFEHPGSGLTGEANQAAVANLPALSGPAGPPQARPRIASDENGPAPLASR